MNPVDADLWSELKRQAIRQVEQEPILSGHLYDLILRHRGYEEALAYLVASSLANQVFSLAGMVDLVGETIARDPWIASSSLDDLRAVTTRDPASECALVPFLYYKGFKGLQAHRVAHSLWQDDRRGVARFLQSRVADSLAIDIHPAARIGRGVFIDHGIGLVIGETSVVEDDVSILQGVTLGGTGKESGDRHPKVRRGVMIGAGAKILGNIEIGEGSKVAAGSVVLKAVAPHSTVAGVPAVPVGSLRTDVPAFDMRQDIDG
ncbi:MAG: serine O-acetyltransferase [Betaproteobacteria bacterium]|nr:serine O-acetyltransferase [Betaproteobacteria bacterium]